MSIVHQLDGCGVVVQEIKGIDPADPQRDPKVVMRNLIVTHQASDQVWVIPMDIGNADDVAGQLRGEPPKKHVALPGELSPQEFVAMRNGHG